MAGAQLNNIQILDLTTGLTRTLETGGTPDILQIETDLQLLTGANLLVDGNLVVNGTTTTLNTEQVNVRDNHLYLNADYTTAAAQTGGFVVNVLPTATNDTVAAGGFTAGVPATSNPTVITAVGGVFSAGDIVQVSGANDQANDGVYEVESHVGTTLTIRGVGLVANTQDWFSNDFATDSTAAGTITLVNVNVLRGTSTGTWETYTGNTTVGLTYDVFTTQGAVDLQSAYEEGNQITTDAGNGNVVIAGTELLQITAAGGIDLNTVFDFDGTSFDVQMTGGNGFSIDGAASSNVTVDNNQLLLNTTTAGNVTISAASDLDLDGATNITLDAGAFISLDAVDSSNFTVAGNAAGAVNLDLAVTNAGAGTGNMLVSADDEIDMTSGGVIDLNASSGMDFSGGTGSFDFDSTIAETTALMSLTTAGAGGDSVGLFVGTSDPNGAVTADAGSLFFRDEGTTGELYLNTSTGSGTTWEQISTGGSIDLQQAYENGNTIVTDATNGPLDVSGTEAISLDAGAASNFTVDSATLTLQTVTSGNLAIASADNVIVNAQDILADATSSISLDAVDVSNFTVSGNSAGATDLTLSASNAGAGTASVLITADNEVDITSASLIDINAAGDLDVDVTGNVTFDSSGSFSADAVGASNVTTDSGALTLSTTTSGTINVDGVGGVEINSTGGFLGLGNDADAQDILIGTGAAARTITVGNSTGATALEFNAGTGAHVFSSTVPETTALVTLTTTGAGGDSVGLFVGDNDPSGTVSADAGSLFFRDEGTTGELYLNTSTGSGTTWSQISTGDTTETLQEAYEAGNAIVTDSTNGDFDVSGTEAISLDAGLASNFTVDGATLTLSTTTSGTLDLTSADDIQMTFETNNATAMVIDDGTNNFMTFDSTTGDLAVEVNQFLDITGSGSGITLTANATIAAGDVVTIEGTSGDAILADSNTGTTIDGLAIGIAATAATASNPVKVYTVPGSLVPVNFAAAPAAAQNGRPVYVSQTAGEGTLTAPTGSGNVVYVIGILQGADGVTTSPNVVYQPQFISLRP